MSYDPTTHATEHFAWSEMDPTGLAGPIARQNLHQLANDVLEPLRGHVGPLTITPDGGYRDLANQTRIWNERLAECGGDAAKARETVAPPGHSQHNFGKAADLYAPTEAAREAIVAHLVENPAVGGIGLYSWGVHVDNRDRAAAGGAIARW